MTAVGAVSFEVALVIILGFVEVGCGGDFGDDRGVEVLLSPLFAFFGLLSLVVGVGEDSGAVLGSDVGTLLVEGCGVVDFPEEVKKLFVGDFFGIESGLNDFGVAGESATDFFVGDVFDVAAHVSAVDLFDAVELAEEVFDTPETAAAECCQCLFAHEFHSMPAGGGKFRR